jgi:hypothetical protein
VTQFNCLQQTGNFCPATSNAASAMTISTPAMSTTAMSTASRQMVADAFFAQLGKQGKEAGSLGTLSASMVDQLASTQV